MGSNHGNLCCQCVSGWHLEQMSPIAWTANGLWPYWVFWGMSLPFLPSHILRPKHTSFSPFLSLTAKQTEGESCVFGHLSAFKKESIIQVNPHSFPQTQVVIVEVWKLLFVSLFSFCLACISLPPPSPETHISVERAVSCTHSKSHLSGLLVMERIFRRDCGREREALTTFCCSFSFSHTSWEPLAIKEASF